MCKRGIRETSEINAVVYLAILLILRITKLSYQFAPIFILISIFYKSYMELLLIQQKYYDQLGKTVTYFEFKICRVI